MPGSKARAWKRAKAKETYDEHYGNGCHLPNIKRKREESPNTAANRKLLKEEMSKRDMGPKTSKSCSSGGKADSRFSYENLMRERDESYAFKSLLYKIKCEDRKNFTKKDRREDWAKKNATKSPEEIRKDEEEKKKREDRQKEEEERAKREEEEERRQKEREEQHRKQEEQKHRYEEHRRKNEERKQMEADRKFMLPSGEDTRKIMELGNDLSTGNIRRMYLKLSLVYHPDKSEIHKDGTMFKKLKESYEWLKKMYGMA